MPKPPGLLRNPLSAVGLLIASVSTAFGLPMMFADMVSRRTNPYLGVVVYLVLPFAAAGGVAIALIGVVWERRRRRRRPGLAVPPLPSIDLNRPAHQLAVIGGLTAIMTVVVLLSITGYRAYHFTESTQFCGLVCHQVMKPEFTAYQHSPHARVTCTQCHVGPGADWFVRSKLSGLYQVYAVASRTYPRPIPAPVQNLRPAQETCEQCHWPEKFFGAQQTTITRHFADEANSPWQIQMLIKVGGGDPKHGATTGIHWHMNIKSDIDYIASDARRDVIPWVRVTGPDGQVTEYVSSESPLTPVQLASMPVRRMDCVDCHNRPSHRFNPPAEAIDQAFESGRLDGSLPYLKREGIRLLIQSYATEADALAAITAGLGAFYRQEYPELYAARAPDVHQAARELQRIYATNLFPEMGADWRAYPNHAGHRNSDGCFRCHDGLHRSAAGKVITKDCNACHTILAQGPPQALQGVPLQEQPFQHPVDVGIDVTEFKCSQCHTGTAGL